MSKELASSIEKAPIRAVYKARGFSEEHISNAVIAVITAKSEAELGSARLSAVCEAVKQGVYASGGTPVEISCLGAGIATGLEGDKFALPTRELIADGVESILLSHSFDGAILIPNCDGSVAGMLMGAVRANIPAILVCGGPSEGGEIDGKKTDLYSVVEAAYGVKSGKVSRGDLEKLELNAISDDGKGSCYSSNAMASISEALGIALSGNGTVPASSPKRIQLSRSAGEKIVSLAENDVRPRMILKREAFMNALALNAAMGGCADATLHILAIANECGISLGFDDISDVSDITPTLTGISSDFHRDMIDFHRSGGVRAVLNQLSKLPSKCVYGDYMTVSGKKLSAIYENKEISGDAIAPASAPISNKGGIAVLKGNIGDDGAIVERSCVPSGMTKFSGKAKVYDSIEDCVLAITGGKVSEGDVLVIRSVGPKGGPGMREVLSPVAALCSCGLNESVAIVTDGRIPDGVKGLVVGHVCPEAAVGGKIALINNGDVIDIDVEAGKLNLKINAKEIAVRAKKYRPQDSEPQGWLLRYKYLVTSADSGAVLKKKF